MDIEKIANVIEADAGQSLTELRDAQGRHGRVTTAEQIMVRAARTRLGLSQTEFAARIGTPVATLRDWEQGRFAPPGAVLCLLRLLIAHPELSSELQAA
ncbi:MAG: XRE family transcriptional regulator [Gammaproteobacteria bacterium HGW-Gammaproteobacteria-8]|jgi:putative transcriptional regulator|nr:MAG: XRE family transcriptional regulator [Gammaproteobacteria bacterium HGW-Gammaproteobacteria-8]PKM16752.1 MAG: XRE family transcriptional regulator [Gammaproteobacteria bacterium HGW-Gammaproteobacteria-2]